MSDRLNHRPIHRPGARALGAGETLPAWIAGLPVSRLAQSFEHETRPRELGLVLILASERELRRAHQLRALRFAGLAAVAAIALMAMALRRHPGAAPLIRPAALTAATLSERLQTQAPSQPALRQLPPAHLHLDEGLRRIRDRGY